jgi:uncharacterized membrane protein required for colicin V production
MDLSLDKLPVNMFDLLLVAFLVFGVFRGRKNGMSGELLNLLKWLIILFGCAALYDPAGNMIAQTSPFSLLTCFLLAYVGGALLVILLFALLKNRLGGKLAGSDVFGHAEYYLGMAAGFIRFSCMLLAAMALLNARHFTSYEVRANEKFQNDVYGSNFFPGLQTLQATVFEKSLTGAFIKENLGFLLIKETDPAPEAKPFKQRELVLP